MNEYEILREKIWIGFAHLYLSQCNKESKSNDEIDKELYSKLIELDTRFGTRASEQLYWSLLNMTRSDIIEVGRFLRMKDL